MESNSFFYSQMITVNSLQMPTVHSLQMDFLMIFPFHVGSFYWFILYLSFCLLYQVTSKTQLYIVKLFYISFCELYIYLSFHLYIQLLICLALLEWIHFGFTIQSHCFIGPIYNPVILKKGFLKLKIMAMRGILDMPATL